MSPISTAATREMSYAFPTQSFAPFFNNSTTVPNSQKTPTVKKGKTFKNSSLKKRLQQEKLRKAFKAAVTSPGKKLNNNNNGDAFQPRISSKPVVFQKSNKIKATSSPTTHKNDAKIFVTAFPGPSCSPRRTIQVSPCKPRKPFIPKEAADTKLKAPPAKAPPAETAPAITQTTPTVAETIAETPAIQTPAETSTKTTATETSTTETSTTSVEEQPQLVSPLVVQDEDCEDEGVASFLCLVPMMVPTKEGDPVHCYWPSLVLESAETAAILHNQLYPLETKVQKKLSKKFLKASCNGTIDEHTIVVLPLGNSEGCCPADISSKPLYDTIDKTSYRTKEGQHRVIRLLKNASVVGAHLKELVQQISIVAPALDEALVELERLTYIDDDDDESDHENEATKENRAPFVPSLRTEREDPPQPVRFPVHEPVLPKRGSKRKSQAPAIRFPLSAEKSERPSDETMQQTEASNTATNSGAQTTTTATTTNKAGKPKKRKRGEKTRTSPRAATAAAAASLPAPRVLPAKDKSKKQTTAKTRRTSPRTSTPAATSLPKIAPRVLPAKSNRKKASSSSSVATTPSPSTNSRQKKPTVIDSQDRISVPAWAKIKPLLRKLGHTFYEEEKTGGLVQHYYCLPNGDPKNNAEAIQGQDYFDTMESYRAHLCAHGVDYFADSNGQSPLSEDDLELIAYWVRFHVFTQRETGGQKGARIADLEFGRKGHAMKVLQRIGYKYVNKLLEGYMLPCSRQVLSEKELWEHLGKHGLSKDCDVSKFESPEERTALEIMIIRKYHGNHGDQAFRCVPKLTPSKDLEEDSEDENEQQQQHQQQQQSQQPNYTPAASKDALEECTRGPSEDGQEIRMSPRKLMTEETELSKSPATGTTQSNDNDESNDARKTSNTQQTSNVNDESSAKESTENSNSSRANESNENEENSNNSGKKRKANMQVPVAPKEVVIEEVDIPGENVNDKLTACQSYIQTKKIVEHGNLSSSMDRIRNFVEAVIESKGRFADGNRMPILYICGSPGTGKTMSTTRLCEAAVAAKKESQEEWEKAPRVCYISCPSVLHNSKYQEGMQKVMERIGPKDNKMKRSANDDKSAATILILDEIDSLLGKKGTESILKQLCTWARDESNVLSIIGISNAVFNSKTNRLRELVGGHLNRLVFQTYRKEDLVKISQAKIGFSVVHQKAHEFLAAKVANSSGDARQYLALVQKTIIYSKRRLSLEKRGAPWLEDTKPVVTIRDAMMAIRETNQKCKETIQSLPSYEKMTLCAGVHLARKLKNKTVQMGKLRELTMRACGMDADVSLEDFKGIIERLHDNGLLKLNEIEKQAFTRTPMNVLLRYPVQFDLQLEDVDSALEDTLMKQDFYKNMVARLEGAIV